MESKHKFDESGKAFILGKTAEQLFVTKMEEQGYNVNKASKFVDTKHHIDYILTKGSENITVDVKSQKRVSRGDNEAQTELIWVEFCNGNGDVGWLYGKASHIAFQQGDKFALIKRNDLLEIVTNLTGAEKVTSAKNALYKLYTRWGREDLLTMIKFSDIEEKCTIV